MTEIIRKNTLLNTCIDNNGDIFKEIRKLRRAPPTQTAAIDGVTSNIESRFAQVYEKLYNSVEDTVDIEEIKDYLNEKITRNSLTYVKAVTPQLVGEAISLLKNDKTDPVFFFNSNCLKNAPFLLCEHLANLFRILLIHGHISPVVLVSTIVPLVKDTLTGITVSDGIMDVCHTFPIRQLFLGNALNASGRNIKA